MPFSLGFWANVKAAVFTWLFYSTPTTSTSYTQIAYAPLTAGNFYTNDAVSNSATYYYSTDGKSWTSGTLPNNSVSNRFWVGNSSRVIAVNPNTTTGGCAYSTNGTTWTTSNLSSSVGINKGIWDGTRFLLVSSSTSTGGLMHSTTGATWASIDVGDGGQDIAFDGSSRYIVLTPGTSVSIQRTCTSDPTVAGNWSNLTFPSADSWITIAYGNGIWVTLKDNKGSYITSTNGTTWTSRSLPFNRNNSADNDAKMIFANGYFYYVSAVTSLTFYLMKSSDGINWTEELSWASSGNLASTLSWAVAPNKIIAGGYSTSTGKFLLGENV